MLIAALAIPASAIAAELSNAKGTSCVDGTVWHFVNNKSGTTTKGYITVYFSTGTVGPQLADSVTPGGTQHFYVTASGEATLDNAFTYTTAAGTTPLPGRLVLSSQCVGGKDGK